MSLINQEIEKRKTRSIKSRLSSGFAKAKESTRASFNKAKTNFQEERKFQSGLKDIEKASYRNSLKKEALKSGKRKARLKYSGNRVGSSSKAISFMKSEGFFGFGDQPTKKKKKNDDAFNMF